MTKMSKSDKQMVLNRIERQKCRTPILQKLFMFLGNGEKAGSGADIIRKGWEDNKWPQPELSERVQPDEIQITLALVNGELNAGKNVGKERDATKDVTKDVTKGLPERQKIIIELIKDNAFVTIPEMSQKTGVVVRTIKRDIENLQAKGVLTREGGRKEGRWVVKEVDIR